MREIKLVNAKVDKLLKCACKCDEKEIKEVEALIKDFEFPDIKSPGPVALKAPAVEKDMKPKQNKLEVQIKSANTYEQLTIEELEELQELNVQSEVVTNYSVHEQATANENRPKSGKKAIESSKTKQPVEQAPKPPTTLAIKSADDKNANKTKPVQPSASTTKRPTQKTKSEKSANNVPSSKPVDSKKSKPDTATKPPISKEDSKKNDSKKKNSKNSKDPLKTSSRSISPPVPPSSQDENGNPSSEACAIM